MCFAVVSCGSPHLSSTCLLLFRPVAAVLTSLLGQFVQDPTLLAHVRLQGGLELGDLHLQRILSLSPLSLPLQVKSTTTSSTQFNTVYTEQNYLGCDLDCYLDYDPEDAPVYTEHSLFNITKSVMIVFIVQSLFGGPEIAIHLISGFKLSRSRSRLSVYTRQNFSIQIIVLCVNGV